MSNLTPGAKILVLLVFCFFIIGSVSIVKKYRSDQDGDGILDYRDKCPEVAGKKKYSGCPYPLEQDLDYDGIGDNEDKCPEVKGEKIFYGCLDPARDKDGDGVPDITDRCKDEAGSPDCQGCNDKDNDNMCDYNDLCPQVEGSEALHGCTTEKYIVGIWYIPNTFEKWTFTATTVKFELNGFLLGTTTYTLQGDQVMGSATFSATNTIEFNLTMVSENELSGKLLYPTGAEVACVLRKF